jgi:hypothetical protein
MSVMAVVVLQTYIPCCSTFPSTCFLTAILSHKDSHRISLPILNQGPCDLSHSLLNRYPNREEQYSSTTIQNMVARQRKSTKLSVSCSAALWEESESKVKIRNCNVWYKVLRPTIKNRGSDSMLPILVLHGGPGIPSDYLETLGLLTEKYGRKVYFYDQIGCGNSDEPKDPSFYSVKQCAEVSFNCCGRLFSTLSDSIPSFSRHHQPL